METKIHNVQKFVNIWRSCKTRIFSTVIAVDKMHIFKFNISANFANNYRAFTRINRISMFIARRNKLGTVTVDPILSFNNTESLASTDLFQYFPITCDMRRYLQMPYVRSDRQIRVRGRFVFLPATPNETFQLSLSLGHRGPYCASK